MATAINPYIEITETGQTEFEIAVGKVSSRARETLFVGTSGWDALISRTSPQAIGTSENPLGAGAAVIKAPEKCLNLISKTTTVKQVGDRIGKTGLTKRAQSKSARITVSAGRFRRLVTRPGQVQRRT